MYEAERELFEERIREFIAVCKYHDKSFIKTINECVERVVDEEGK